MANVKENYREGEQQPVQTALSTLPSNTLRWTSRVHNSMNAYLTSNRVTMPYANIVIRPSLASILCLTTA